MNYRLFKLNQWEHNGVDVFLPFLPLSTAKLLDIIYKANNRRL